MLSSPLMKKTLCYRIFLYFSKPYETAYNLSPPEAPRNETAYIFPCFKPYPYETAYISQRKSSVQQPNVVKPLTLCMRDGERLYETPYNNDRRQKKTPHGTTRKGKHNETRSVL